jgi:transcriptional regulator with XRE-family HTH domain
VQVRDRHTLRAYLRLCGLSERGLAVRAGIGHATVNHLLAGRRETCSDQTARAIETVLGVPPGVFFEAIPASTRPVGVTVGAPGAARPRLRRGFGSGPPGR